MKVTLDLDKDNYLICVSHTPYDDFELDESIDLYYSRAYKFVNGKLILDEKKLEALKIEKQREKDIEEIERLKQELASTDYQAIKYSEGWFTEEEYAPIKAKRESLREQIRALESNI